MPGVAFPGGQKRNGVVQTPSLKCKEQKRKQKATPKEIETKGEKEWKKRRQQCRKETKPSAKNKKKMKSNTKGERNKTEEGKKRSRDRKGKTKQNQVHKDQDAQMDCN